MSPLRPTAPLGLGAVVAVVSVGWFAVGLGRPTPPLIGWWSVPVAIAVAAWACVRAGSATGAASATRRFWRHATVGIVIIGCGGVSSAHDALAGPVPVQAVSSFTAAIFMAGLMVMMWGLLRIPGLRRSRGDWLRFGLDIATVIVTVTTFAWHFTFRNAAQWSDSTAGAWSVLAVLAGGCVCILAFVKVAFTGTGPVDRRSLHLLALTGAVGAVGGALAPLVAGRPYLNGAEVTIPMACLTMGFAADRQRRAATAPPGPVPQTTRRPLSVLPYAAVIATSALLLSTAAGHNRDTLAVAVGTVALTLLVATRQFTALRDNARLVGTLNAKLEQVNRYQQQLAHQASHDALTDLPNRAFFTDHTQLAIATGASVSVILIDLDDFKSINDDLGHAVGDALLIAVGRRLAEAVPVGGCVARLGGDEYAVLLEHGTHDGHMRTLAALAMSLRRTLAAAGHQLVVEASMGLAVGWPDADGAELLRRADVAMYEAKAQGKGRALRYEPVMDQHTAEQALIAADLRVAFDEGQLYLLYQPIVRMHDARIVGVEALIRWQHPRRGLISPDRFIPVAERTGLIVPIGRWILQEVCLQARQWQPESPAAAPFTVSVNVSPRQLRETGFVQDVADALHRTGLAPRSLVIEVTETAVFDGGAAMDALHDLKALGLGIALDDFGTGHSSLGLLRTCPVDVLKVDKTFIDNVETDGEPTVLAAALIQISNGLGLRAIAEGVETPAQATKLRHLGYHYAQGFLYSRPVTPAAITNHLEQPQAVGSTA